jgi:hypothetical protein
MHEYPGRHVGVPDQIMRLTNQFVVGETAYVDKRVIAVSDSAIEIGGGDQALIGGE